MSGQLPPLIDRELFFGDAKLSAVEVSPDGRWLSFSKPYNGTMNLWLQPIQDGELGEAFPITSSDRRPIVSHYWSQDSRYILYEQDKDGDENLHLYRINIAEASSGKIPPVTDLTPRPGAAVRLHALPRKKPEIAYIGLNDRDPALHDLYELNLTTGQLKLLYENKDAILGWAIDEVGNIRFAGKLGPEGETQIYAVQKKGASFSLKKVYETAWDESANIAHIPQKGNEIYLITNKGVDKTRLVLFNPATGKEQEIHRDPENKVDVAGVLFDDDTDKLRAVWYIDDKPRRYIFDPKIEKWFSKWLQLLPGGEISISSLSRDERYAVVVFSSDRVPARYYFWDAQKESLREIGSSRPELSEDVLTEMRPMRVRSRDGAEIPAYLTLPKGVPPRNLPAVVLVHGGPWARDIWGYDPLAQFLANRGYAVLQVNFRGSTGYGKAFINAGNKQWGTGIMQHDLTDAVQQLIKEGIFDPKRVAIMGGSYGGYATLAGVTFTPELYACGISIVGPSSIITLIRSVPPYWRPLMKIFEHRVGNINDPQDVERLKAQSPLHHVERIRVPLLIVQGANDPRVKKQESDQIVAALHKKGYPVRYLLAPDEGHGFVNYDNRMAMIVAIEQFLSEQLGGRLQPEVPEKIALRLNQITVDPAKVQLPEADATSSKLTRLNFPIRAPMSTAWEYQIKLPGKEILGEGSERWERTEKGWRFISSMTSKELSALTSSDTTEVDETGELLRYHRAQQGVDIFLQREGQTLRGSFQFMGNTNAIQTHAGEQPVYPFGNALIYYLGGLPLSVGYKSKIPVFSIQQQAFSEMEIAVEKEETIHIGNKTLTVWQVQLEVENSQQRVWLDKATAMPVKIEISTGGITIVGKRKFDGN
ncbi:MAG: S9 family peptidase [Bacteroidia bacterium]|nr:S9 family peptidase [Bacteroidia bacterium]MCX7651392.1 S9 family peptidase [Bacteroidia bacterium]MDW8416708.1 alpha/beta fold hydrolase [Bacteroidia bacterium]